MLEDGVVSGLGRFEGRFGEIGMMRVDGCRLGGWVWIAEYRVSSFWV